MQFKYLIDQSSNVPDLSKYTFRSPQLKDVLSEAVTFFSSIPFSSLPPDFEFNGPGVYGLYYFGDFELYKKLSELNKQGAFLPIYIGKAVPPGWRTGRSLNTDEPALRNRLREHRNSINKSTNLNSQDFKCKFVILKGFETALIVPLEAELIRKYTPLWNSFVYGFGIHHPGGGRFGQAKSEWDALHPGRSWVDKLTGTPPQLEDIHSKIKEYYKKL
jgi:hypothetical protein